MQDLLINDLRQQGDRDIIKQALSKIYEMHNESLVKYLRFELGPWKDEAEDLAHDVILILPEKISSFNPEVSKSKNPFKKWIFTIAHNKAVDFMRRKKNLVPLEEACIKSIDPFTETVPSEKTKEFKSCLNNLNKKDKFKLYVIISDKFSKEQKAKLLGVKPDTLRQILKRIRDKLCN